MSSSNLVTIVITDASCLIILDEIGHLDILRHLFDSVITTSAIAAEFIKPLPDWIKVINAVNENKLKELSKIVDGGEASAIALAQEIEVNYVVTDDLDARKLCAKLNIPCIGTLGVMLRTKEHGLIPEIKTLLENIRLTNFRINDDLYNTVLSKAGEL